MAYDPTAERYGMPGSVSFGGDDHPNGGYRAYKWDVGANKGKPIAPTDQNFDGVSTADGAAGIPATPGLLVQVEATIPNGVGISAGTTYGLANNGLLDAANIGGSSAFKSAETVSTNISGSTITQVIWAIIWKPHP